MLDDGGSVVHTEEEEGTQSTGVYHLGRRSSSCILFILQQSLFDSNTQQLLGSTKRQLSRGHPIPQNKKNKKKENGEMIRNHHRHHHYAPVKRVPVFVSGSYSYIY